MYTAPLTVANALRELERYERIQKCLKLQDDIKNTEYSRAYHNALAVAYADTGSLATRESIRSFAEKAEQAKLHARTAEKQKDALESLYYSQCVG
jgi:hypothetical protein